MFSMVAGVATIITGVVAVMVLIDGFRECLQRYRVLTSQLNATRPAFTARNSPVSVSDFTKLPLRSVATQSLQSV